MSRISASTSARRHGDGVRREQPLHDLRLEPRPDRLGKLALHVLAHFRAQGHDAAISDPESLAESVVHFRQAAFLDLAHDRLEARGLPRQVARLVVVGEAQVELALLARRRAEHALLEVRQQSARAEDDHEVLALAAFERLAADAALEIHRDAVAVAAAARDFIPVRPLPAQAFDHRVDVAVADGRDGARKLDAAHVVQLDLRVHLEGRGVAQVVGLAGLLRLDAGTARRLQFFLAQGFGERLADEVGNDLFPDLRAIVLAHHVDRGLARTETLDADGAADLQEARVDLLAHAACGHRHFDPALEPG